ncbi:MAG: cell division protein [Spirochaetae bacterium HGW-Spirochaetae-1]|jgi:cytoskeletal protein CcmA (bactofilin family)|nr:MAG: cell division protein [Spirochaetae bacterium HGW-Spirochaetae-1]
MTKKVIQVSKNPVYDIGMISTVFARDTEFSGDLTFKKSLQINGKFDGEISSGGFLVIGEGAEVRANIRAKTVILMGTVFGNIEAENKLEIHTSGRLFGNIRTSQLKIADGVVFEGKCEMIKADEKKQKKEAVKPEKT